MEQPTEDRHVSTDQLVENLESYLEGLSSMLAFIELDIRRIQDDCDEAQSILERLKKRLDT